ncbi:MAG TPA: MerR family transcriptional regulator [Ktedonobacteraceae bacterium]|nr:MerR family transcriptional regulator [Ktedonobacteraceae bacterium]
MSIRRTDDNIKEYLQEREVQKRVQQLMQDARSRATVSISRAANLFGFSENQLRDWEKRGLLQADRSGQTTEGKGHRQYTTEDLDRLALIRELLNNDFSINEIPPDILATWHELIRGSQQTPSAELRPDSEAIKTSEYPIDTQVDHAEEENFWRLFISNALRLTLMLISEDAPTSITGLILPLNNSKDLQPITSPYDVGNAGPSLVGWLAQNQALYASYEPSPAFEYPSDFRIEYLPGWNTKNCPSPIIILQRRTRTPIFTSAFVETTQRLFELIFRHRDEWQPCFSYGLRDRVDHVTNFWLSSTISDLTLDKLLNIMVELGGEEHGSSRWSFSNLFLPQDRTLPIQQRTLVVRSHSQNAPGLMSTFKLSNSNPGLSFRAYQSGQVLYRSRLVENDAMLAYSETEESTRSAIALPLISADGLTAGVVYIASDYVDAFTVEDQRVLRLMTKMLEELLAAFQARLFVEGTKLSEIITRPHVVDDAFADFLTEEDFLNELEQLLTHILHESDEQYLQGKEVSFICIDIDNQSSLAIKFGDRATRNLSREVGLLLKGQLQLQSNPDYRRVFHIGADRYYLKLVDMSLDEAHKLARQLRRLLRGEYRIDVRRDGKPLAREEKLILSGVTVRMGVANYKFLKLKEVLHRYPADHAVAETRTLISKNLDQSLIVASELGGDCIITWDHVLWGYKLLERGEPQSS